MKATLPENYKDIFTISDLEAAKKVIAEAKADKDGTFGDLKEWAESAARAIANKKNDWFKHLLDASAEVARNGRIDWNGLFEGSQRFDIWIRFTARTDFGFIEGGAYLSDIWGISGDDSDTLHMFFQYFTEQK